MEHGSLLVEVEAQVDRTLKLVQQRLLNQDSNDLLQVILWPLDYVALRVDYKTHPIVFIMILCLKHVYHLFKCLV